MQNPNTNPPMATALPSLNGHVAGVFAFVLFATGFPSVTYLLDYFGTISLIATRMLLATALVVPLWVILRGWSEVCRAPWIKAVTIGASTFGVGAILFVVAQSMSNGVTAAIVATTMPVTAVTLEVLLDGRKLVKKFAFGVILVLLGGYLATGANLGDGQFGLGIVVGLIATVFFGVGSRAAVKALPDMNFLGRTATTTVGMTLTSLIIWAALPVLNLSGGEVTALPYVGIGLMFLYSWGAYAVSQALWLVAVDKLGIGLASFHTNATPFYVMMIVLCFGGTWNWNQAIGAAILAMGVILAQQSDRRRKSQS